MAHDNYPENTFQRSWYLTLIGLLHITYGFFSTLWSCVRMLIIGNGPVMQFGNGYIFLIYLFEAHSLLLWASGVGVLRNKRWGILLGLAWCLVSLVLNIINHFVRIHFWGIAAPSFSWGFYVLVYYTFLYSMVFFVVPLLRQHGVIEWILEKIRNVDLRYVKTRLAGIKMRRSR